MYKIRRPAEMKEHKIPVRNSVLTSRKQKQHYLKGHRPGMGRVPSSDSVSSVVQKEMDPRLCN